MSHPWPRSDAWPLGPVLAETPRASRSERWGWLEIFAAIQLLWGALLFLPSLQPVRMYIRAMPYLASLGALLYYARHAPREPWPASSRWLLASIALLGANLLHAETQLHAGLAQLVFQISIAAPMFWVGRIVSSRGRLERLLWIVFFAGLASAAVGILQVYWPEWFLPTEFSALARRLNPEIIGALSYYGPDGRPIVRPPGLSDMPGGAAVAGLTTVLLAVAAVSHERTSWIVRLLSVGASAVGMTVLYLTQVRSLTVMAAIGVLMFAAIRLRQGRVMRSGWIALGGVALVAASFVWAAAIGGTSIEDRYSGLLETGLFQTFQESRGIFLDYTFRDLLFRFPLGAGLGRWGMMSVYFDDLARWYTPPIHVEIQITGWLLDGGVLMWLCYGGALLSAVRTSYRSAVDRADESLQYVSAIVLVLQLTIVALCLTGPIFNTQLGSVFWMVTGALYGATRAARLERGDENGHE
jgi:hypothetical protein